jgi:copper chaperone NosL
VGARRRFLLAWTGIFASVALAGLADFWRWGYDYGHDLDPTAAIRVPGMSYQPPLIGTKQLLNFQATSWPAAGGWALVLALTIAVVLCLFEWRRARRGALAAAALALVACGSPKPAEIAFGSAVCEHCHMTISEPRFAAQLVTTRHRTRGFDDPGCLAAFVASGEMPHDQIHSLWVNDYLEPGTLLPAESALFVRSDSLLTPMSSHVVAVGRRGAADSLARALSGIVLTWPEIVADAGHGAH